VKVGKFLVIESTANEVKAACVPADAFIAFNETACVVLAEPCVALYKLPNDKFVLAMV
jgi:hypothetical protein